MRSLILCILLLAPACWATDAQLYCSPDVVDHTKVPNTDQTNFPVLRVVTDARFKDDANGGHVASSSGYDLIPYSDSACTTRLHFQRMSYTASSGAIRFWVKVGTVATAADTTFYWGYGDTGIATDQQDPANVWSGYVGVWHLEDNAANTTVVDASANNNSTAANNTSGYTATGKLGLGFALPNSSYYVTLGSLSLAGATSPYTTSAWIKLTDTDSCLFCFRSTSSGNAIWDFVVGSDGIDNTGTGKLALIVRDDSSGGLTHIHSTGTVNDGNWHYVAATRSAGQALALYIDGAPDGSGTDTMGAAATWNAARFGLDYQNGSLDPNVTVDELHVSAAQRSADWIATEYNNQSDPAAFSTLGTEVTLGAAAAPRSML